jgi:N-methylhydantoinase A/oxoprolinase/acetone carboxylase beta subunit
MGRYRLGADIGGTFTDFLLRLYQQGEDQLQLRLSELNVDQLQDIIAEHDMDRSKLAVRWKSRERLISLILSTVRQRLNKGAAFRTEQTADG